MIETNQAGLEILDWGLLDYREAFRRQLRMVEKRRADLCPDRLVFVEHPPVVTVGRGGDEKDLVASRETLTRQGVDYQAVDRGGRATYHGPGQLVAYPIVKLRRGDLHAFLDALLEAAASTLRRFGLRADREDGRRGLWVNSAKIASVGLAVRGWVTYHGLALNVNNGLEGFARIIPCGHAGETMTSMKNILGRDVELDGVKAAFAEEFRKVHRSGPGSTAGTVDDVHPYWLVRRAPDESAVDVMENLLGRLGLTTVCQNALCPNLGECFGAGTATFMILGRNCTRRCRFCAVGKASPEPVDPMEPHRVARAARMLELRHVVITSVTRDDLPDGGAGHFARTIDAVRNAVQGAAVEVLTPDFKGAVSAADQVIAARPDVFNHNIETVARLYPAVRPEAVYRRSLGLLRYASGKGMTVKSGLMLGLGETDGEIKTTLIDLKRAGCDFITIGQYLAPSPGHFPIKRYVSPEEFDYWAAEARAMGFTGTASGPLVRSSYRADDLFAFSKSRTADFPKRKTIQS